MGRRLDVLLGRTTKQTARLKSLLGLATARLGVLRGHRQVRCAQARGDAEQLLLLGAADRALIRAEQVVRERNALDALVMLEGYCNLLVERAALLDDDARARRGECPEELREAAAGLVYAAARCGDVPELQEVRRVLAAKFGREFVAAASDLRSGCGVSHKIVQKLSTRQPSLESRQMVLQEIAAEKGIPVRFHEPSSYEEDTGRSSNQRNKERISRPHQVDEIEEDISAGADSAQSFKDVEAAAQAAFESAASAAAAAKAAMELSRGQPRGPAEQAKKKGEEIGHARGYSSETEDFPENEVNRANIVGSEMKHHEQQGKPASVRTRRGF